MITLVWTLLLLTYGLLNNQVDEKTKQRVSLCISAVGLVYNGFILFVYLLDVFFSNPSYKFKIIFRDFIKSTLSESSDRWLTKVSWLKGWRIFHFCCEWDNKLNKVFTTKVCCFISEIDPSVNNCHSLKVNFEEDFLYEVGEEVIIVSGEYLTYHKTNIHNFVLLNLKKVSYKFSDDKSLSRSQKASVSSLLSWLTSGGKKLGVFSKFDQDKFYQHQLTISECLDRIFNEGDELVFLGFGSDVKYFAVGLDESDDFLNINKGLHKTFIDLSKHYWDCLEPLASFMRQKSTSPSKLKLPNKKWKRFCTDLSHLNFRITGSRFPCVGDFPPTSFCMTLISKIGVNRKRFESIVNSERKIYKKETIERIKEGILSIRDETVDSDVITYECGSEVKLRESAKIIRDHHGFDIDPNGQPLEVADAINSAIAKNSKEIFRATVIEPKKRAQKESADNSSYEDKIRVISKSIEVKYKSRTLLKFLDDQTYERFNPKNYKSKAGVLTRVSDKSVVTDIAAEFNLKKPVIEESSTSKVVEEIKVPNIDLTVRKLNWDDRIVGKYSEGCFQSVLRCHKYKLCSKFNVAEFFKGIFRACMILNCFMKCPPRSLIDEIGEISEKSGLSNSFIRKTVSLNSMSMGGKSIKGVKVKIDSLSRLKNFKVMSFDRKKVIGGANL